MARLQAAVGDAGVDVVRGSAWIRARVRGGRRGCCGSRGIYEGRERARSRSTSGGGEEDAEQRTEIFRDAVRRGRLGERRHTLSCHPRSRASVSLRLKRKTEKEDVRKTDATARTTRSARYCWAVAPTAPTERWTSSRAGRYCCAVVPAERWT